MQCSAPLVGINIPSLRRNKKTEELEYRSNTVLSRDKFLALYRRVDHYTFCGDDLLITHQDKGEDIFAGAYKFHDLSGETVYPYPVPCGTCMNCRLRRSAEWADRMTCESMTSKYSSWFVTLTYDQGSVPVNDSLTAYTLKKADLDDFIKNYQNFCFRKGLSPRHYASGEYGDETFRPHYHLILFNLPLSDTVFIGKNNKGDLFYESETINKLWKRRGFAPISECSWNTCAYTARYVTKKQYGKTADAYEKLDLVPEFQKVSNRPGVGYEYFEKNLESIFRDNKLYLPHGRISPVPSYFDRKYQEYLCTIEDDNEALRLSELYLESKKQRADLARSGFHDKVHLLQVSEKEYFESLELLSKKVDKKLKRTLDSIR